MLYLMLLNVHKIEAVVGGGIVLVCCCLFVVVFSAS